MDNKIGTSGEVGSVIVPVWLQVMIALVALSAIAMLIKYLSTFGVQTSRSQEVWGQFGDFFGGILNPLLSSLTLAAVLVTLRLQAKELRAAQLESRRANEHLEKQANYIRTQNFESVFFRLLDVHMSAKANVTVGELSGKAAFEHLKRVTFPILHEVNNRERTAGLDDRAEWLNVIGYEIRRCTGDSLNVYCRGMYQLLKYVDTYEGFYSEASVPQVIESEFKELTPSQKFQQRREQDRNYRPIYYAKRQYVNMLRAQLTSLELTVLYLVFLTEECRELKNLAEKYSLFKGVHTSRLKPGFGNEFYSYLAFADYEEVSIRDVRMLDALGERLSSNKKRFKKSSPQAHATT